VRGTPAWSRLEVALQDAMVGPEASLSRESTWAPPGHLAGAAPLHPDAPASRLGAPTASGWTHPSLAAPQGSVYIVFQQASDYRAPVWPPVDGAQRPMMHFDFQVGDLDSAVADAVALGATVAAEQPQENVRVLMDPAGHPFCLCRDDG
jgi:hypothetical protein